MTTTPTTRPSTGYLDHTLVGSPDQVAAVIRRHHQAGTFVAMGAPQPVAPADPRISVRIRLTAPAARPIPATVHTRPTPARSIDTATAERSRRARTHRRLGVTLTLATAVVAIAFTVGYLAARATAEAVVNAAATIAGFAILTAIAAALQRGRGTRRRHCPGCK